MSMKQSIDRAIWLRFAVLTVTATLSSGCGYLMQARDHARPTAVPEMRMAQTLNPEAGKNRKVVAGLDGSASANVSEAYVDSFEATDARTEANMAFQGLSGLGSN